MNFPFYILITLVCLLLVLYKKEKLYIYIAFSILFLFHIFKDPFLLPDGDVYCDVFNIIKNTDINNVLNWNLGYKIEIGYRLYNKLLALVCSHPFFFYLCNALIILAGPFVIINRYSNWKSISVLLFFLFGYLSGLGLIRQYMAYSIIYFSLPYIINRDWKKFFLVLFVAFSIHNSSVVFLVIYLLYGLSGKKFWILLSLSFLFVLVSFSSLQTFVGEDYETYLNSSYTTIGLFVAMAVIVFTRIIVMKGQFLSRGVSKLLSIISLMALICSLYGCLLPGMWYRLIGYFSIITVVITLPNTIKYMNNNIQKKVFILIFLFIYIYMFYVGIQNSEYEYKLVFNSPFSMNAIFIK